MIRSAKNKPQFRGRAPVQGHFWTIVPHIRDQFLPPKALGVPWTTELVDPVSGSVQLSGILSEVPGANRLVVIVHGMGGNASKGYVTRLAHHAETLGMSSLRLNLRGADNRGDDIYHGALVADMAAAVASPELAKYEHLHAIGFSLGGHMVASYALDPEPRMRSVCALCSPIDLDAGCDFIDKPKQAIYRRHLLVGLRGSVSRLKEGRDAWLGDADLRRVRLMREWDNRVTAKRFGYESAREMYKTIGIGVHLENIAIPALMVFAKDDPMVRGASIAPALNAKNPNLVVRKVAGGHVHMPAKTRVLRDSLAWFMTHGK